MDYLTGNLGEGGASKCAAELTFHGNLGETFVAFVVRRANRLSLRGWIEAHNTNSVTVTAEGPEALVDALEIACSLGPIDSDVESWTRSDKPIGVNAAAFERRVESVVGKD